MKTLLSSFWKETRIGCHFATQMLDFFHNSRLLMMITKDLSSFASIPCLVREKPKKIFAFTLNTHLLGFLSIVFNISFKSDQMFFIVANDNFIAIIYSFNHECVLVLIHRMHLYLVVCQLRFHEATKPTPRCIIYHCIYWAKDKNPSDKTYSNQWNQNTSSTFRFANHFGYWISRIWSVSNNFTTFLCVLPLLSLLLPLQHSLGNHLL